MKIKNTKAVRRFDLDLEAIHWFTLIVEQRSFLPVAGALKIPKSTLSRRIANLEHQLGSQLLLRNSHVVKPTEFGLKFYSKAVGILGAIDESREASDRIQRELEGPIRIAAGFEFGTAVLSSIISKFSKQHPKVIIDLVLGERNQLDLLQEGFDLAVRVGPLKSSSLISRTIGNISYGLFASPEYLKTYGTPKSLNALPSHQTLLFTGGHYPDGWKMFDGKKKRILNLNPRMRSNTHAALRDAAVSGLGICFMPRFLVASEVREGALRPILPHITSWELPIHVLFPERKYMPSKIRIFVDYLVEEFRNDPNCRMK